MDWGLLTSKVILTYYLSSFYAKQIWNIKVFEEAQFLFVSFFKHLNALSFFFFLEQQNQQRYIDAIAFHFLLKTK